MTRKRKQNIMRLLDVHDLGKKNISCAFFPACPLTLPGHLI